MLFIRRKGAEGKKKKTSGAIVGILGAVLVIGISLTPSFLFADYKGLPSGGQYEVAETQLILVDNSRTESFETDGSNREVPVHIFYPKTENAKADEFPLVVFSHGAFGFYESNASTFMELASNGSTLCSASSIRTTPSSHRTQTGRL